MTNEYGLSNDALHGIVKNMRRPRGWGSRASIKETLRDIEEMEWLGEKYKLRLEPLIDETDK